MVRPEIGDFAQVRPRLGSVLVSPVEHVPGCPDPLPVGPNLGSSGLGDWSLGHLGFLGFVS